MPWCIVTLWASLITTGSRKIGFMITDDMYTAFQWCLYMSSLVILTTDIALLTTLTDGLEAIVKGARWGFKA